MLIRGKSEVGIAATQAGRLNPVGANPKRLSNISEQIRLHPTAPQDTFQHMTPRAKAATN